jgi:aspartate aminotransferase-like enzyme
VRVAGTATAPYRWAVGLGASLQLVNELGTAAIERHVRALTERLHEELPPLGLRVVTRPEPEARSGITTSEVSEAACTPDWERPPCAERPGAAAASLASGKAPSGGPPEGVGRLAGPVEATRER